MSRDSGCPMPPAPPQTHTLKLPAGFGSLAFALAFALALAFGSALALAFGSALALALDLAFALGSAALPFLPFTGLQVSQYASIS